MICANCGAPRGRRGDACAHCGQPYPLSIVADLLPVAPQRLALAVVIDLLAALLFVTAFLALTGGRAVWGAVALFVLVIAAETYALLTVGQTLGLRVTGARVVLSDTGSAPGLRSRGWRIAETRRGADPLLPRAPRLDVTGRTATATDGSTAVHASASPELIVTVPGFVPGARTVGAVLVVDEETRVPVTSAMVVGRDPAATEGTTVVAVPDLARELSKGHFRIGQDPDGAMTVTDLSSTNGTVLNGTMLVPRTPYSFTFEDVINAGGHRFRVEPRGRAGLGDAP